MFRRTVHPSGIELFEFLCGDCSIYMSHVCAEKLLKSADVHKRVLHDKRLRLMPRSFQNHYLRKMHQNFMVNN